MKLPALKGGGSLSRECFAAGSAPVNDDPQGGRLEFVRRFMADKEHACAFNAELATGYKAPDLSG